MRLAYPPRPYLVELACLAARLLNRLLAHRVCRVGACRELEKRAVYLLRGGVLLLLERREETVSTKYGDVKVKISEGFGVKKIKPGYDDIAGIIGRD